MLTLVCAVCLCFTCDNLFLEHVLIAIETIKLFLNGLNEDLVWLESTHIHYSFLLLGLHILKLLSVSSLKQQHFSKQCSVDSIFETIT